MKRKFISGTETKPKIKRMKRQRNNWKIESYINPKWKHVPEGFSITRTVNPQILLTEKEKKIFDFLMQVVRSNNLHDTILRVAGGWVRDKVLGAESDDIDIAINNLTGAQFCQFVVKHLEEGKKFAVIQSNPDQSKHLETANMLLFDQSVDFVNLRTEEYANDDRIPSSMGMGTPLEDALRRDLTINSLFYNINTGLVEDLTKHGVNDLRERVVRTPLQACQTFLDDPLRILRSIRFSCRFDFSIHEDIFESCQTKMEVRQALKTKVSRERFGIEISKMLKTNDPPGGFALIQELGIQDIVFCVPTDDPSQKKVKKKKKKKAIREFMNPQPIEFPGQTYRIGLSRMRVMMSLLKEEFGRRCVGVSKEVMILSSFFTVLMSSMKSYSKVSHFCENFLMESIRYSKLWAKNTAIMGYYSKRIFDEYINKNEREDKELEEEREGEEEEDDEKRKMKSVEDLKKRYRQIVFHEKRLELGQMIRKIGKVLFYPTVLMSIVQHIQVNELKDSIFCCFSDNRSVKVIKSLVFWDVVNEDNFWMNVVDLKPLLNGKQVCEVLKIKPGKIIATVLEGLINEQITRLKMTKEQAIEFVRTNFGK